MRSVVVPGATETTFEELANVTGATELNGPGIAWPAASSAAVTLSVVDDEAPWIGNGLASATVTLCTTGAVTIVGVLRTAGATEIVVFAKDNIDALAVGPGELTANVSTVTAAVPTGALTVSVHVAVPLGGGVHGTLVSAPLPTATASDWIPGEMYAGARCPCASRAGTASVTCSRPAPPEGPAGTLLFPPPPPEHAATVKAHVASSTGHSIRHPTRITRSS